MQTHERVPPGGRNAFVHSRIEAAGGVGRHRRRAHIGLTPGCFVNGCGLATAGVGGELVIGLTPGSGA